MLILSEHIALVLSPGFQISFITLGHIHIGHISLIVETGLEPIFVLFLFQTVLRDMDQ
jgi:hypothetical protein